MVKRNCIFESLCFILYCAYEYNRTPKIHVLYSYSSNIHNIFLLKFSENISFKFTYTHSFMKYFFLTKIICMGKAFSFRSANSFEDSVDMFCHNWIQLGKPQKIFVDYKIVLYHVRLYIFMWQIQHSHIILKWRHMFKDVYNSKSKA